MNARMNCVTFYKKNLGMFCVFVMYCADIVGYVSMPSYY